MTPKKLEAQAQPTVFVIDDDPAIRQGVSSLLRSVDICAETFGSPKEFVPEKLPDAPCCLVLDVRFGGLSGLDLQAELDNAGINIPIVFITGHGDIPMSVRAMKAGAVEFLTKPFRDDDLLGAVRVALERDRQQREKNKSLAIIRSCFERLTAREHEVFALVTTGLMNKQIAGQLAISDITVKVHRGNMTRKMGARSFVELVRMADALRLPSRV
jgi:FixJ family two-component response regulator